MRYVRQPGANRREHEGIESLQCDLDGLWAVIVGHRGEDGVDRGVDGHCLTEGDPLGWTLRRHEVGEVVLLLPGVRSLSCIEAVVANKLHERRVTRHRC